MRVEVVSTTPLSFRDGTPVRAASGVAAYRDGWLVIQDDATHACHWVDGVGQRVRLLPPTRGLDLFDEASGTKELKPDLEAVVNLPGGLTLVLGSGSTPSRMRSVLLSEASVVTARLEPVYERVAEVLGVRGTRLNLEGACVVGETLRWFQRGLPSAGAPSASVDLDLGSLVAAVSGRAAAVRVSAPRSYDLGQVDGVDLTITDAVTLDGGLVMVSAVAEDTATTYDDGPVAGSALALLDGDRVMDVAALGHLDRRVAKVEGLALARYDGGTLRLVAVVDADDPTVPSSMLELSVEP